jgi:molecular chaperone Hsp33
MPDELLRMDLPERGLIAFIAETSGTALEAEWRHLSGRIAAEALGRALAGAALVAGFLGGDQQLSLQVKCEGKLRGLHVDVDAEGRLRGYTDRKSLPPMDAGPSDFSYAIGSSGILTVISSTASAVRYSGSVEISGGDLATDLERYLAKSEQRDSILELATSYDDKLTYAGGMLLQAQPGADREFFAALRERREAIRRALVEERSPERVASRVFAGERAEVAARRSLRFSCRCSRERALRMIGGLDPAELRDMIETDGGATITCHFCNDR